MTSKKSRLLRGVAIAFGVLGCQAGTGHANDSLIRATADANNWAMYGRGYDNTRFSPLSQITAQNAAQLKLAFAYQLGSLRSNEATPIVIGDTMYVSTSWGPKYVYALDAKTGQKKWRYEPDIPDDVMQYGCCDVVNRGVTYADGKIFVGRLDGFLAAVDAKSGEELWTTQVVDYKQGAVITSPPLVVKNLVISGFGGGEYGVRGSLQAYDINTGKQVWKTWTVPGPGEPGNETWKGDSWQHGGGVVWLIGSYDPKTNTVFYGTSNPSPWNAAVRSTGTSDYGNLRNLYTASTLAIDPDTGKIKWYLQSTPQDAWDFDGVNEAVLADLKIAGQDVPAMLKADRNGFFYVANRETGKLISAEKFVPTTWAEKIDIATAKPVEDPEKRAQIGRPAKDICPKSDRRQELATDVVQSRHGPRLYPIQQPVHGLVGQRGILSQRRLLPRRRVPHLTRSGRLPGRNNGVGPGRSEKGLGRQGGSAIQRRHADHRGRAGVLWQLAWSLQSPRRQVRPGTVEDEPGVWHWRRSYKLLGRWQAVCRRGRRPHRIDRGLHGRHRQPNHRGHSGGWRPVRLLAVTQNSATRSGR